jgi:hypothetical protein
VTIAPDTAIGSDLEFLTPTEQEHATALRRDSENALSLTEVGLALGAGFLFYRLYMTKRLRREIRGGITATQLAAATEYHFRKFLPIWSFVTIPAMVRAMILGSPDQGLPDEIIFALADDYSKRVGGYLNASSKESLMEGFNSYLNKRQNRVVAGNKALDGFGLTKQQTRALVVKKDRPPVNSTRNIPIDRDRELYVEQAAFSRALTVGDNEAYAASQHGKQIGWMFLQREGRISADAKRMWITARDERVCKACGPMHRKTAKIDEPFETEKGDVWAPSLHPNCRCTMVLRGLVRSQFELAKDLYGGELAEFNRKVRRADDGKFTFKPKVKEREVDPSLDEILRQATELRDAPEKVVIPSKVKIGGVKIPSKVSIGEKISIPSQQGEFSRTTIPKATIPKTVLSVEKLKLINAKADLLPSKVTINRTAFNKHPVSPKTPEGPESISHPLGYHVGHFDANVLFTGHESWEGPGRETGVAIISDRHDFYDMETLQESIDIAYDQEAKFLAKSVDHRVMVTDPDTGAKLHVSPARAQALILAILNGNTSDEVEAFSDATGIKREDYASTVYLLDSVYNDAEHEAEGYLKAPGPYVIYDEKKPADDDFPVTKVYLRPFEDHEFQDYNNGEWEYYDYENDE